MKRGQGMQFNWVFILFVSIIILLFFAGFLYKYLNLQESKQDAQIARKFSNSILSMKSTEQYKEFTVSSPFRVDYDCEDLIINQRQRFKIPYVIAMDSFNTDDLIMWVEEYKRGFLVDRVVFITDASKKYYFDDKYISNLPPTINLVENPRLADVVVSSSSTFYEQGKKNVDTNGKEDFFVYVEAFSNEEIANCVKEKLDENFGNLLLIYRAKAEQISFNENCNYNPLVSALDSGDVQSIIDENKFISNSDCEVVF